jgi:hypothetical protein
VAWSACLHEAAGHWIIRASNLQIPVITYYCNNPGFVNLGGAESASLWETHITDENTYNKVVRDLRRYWIPGPYSQAGIEAGRLTTFVWEQGIREHEEEHFDQRVRLAEQNFNRAFAEIRRMSEQAPVASYQCPEDAMAALRSFPSSTYPVTGDGYVAAFERAKEATDNPDDPNSEPDADAAARPIYQAILGALTHWGENREW